MKAAHLPLLVCPQTSRPLELNVVERVGDRIKSGSLVEPIDGKEYEIKEFIPRFVPEENYATTFGYQWNLHRDTQRDDYSGASGSAVRFFAETKWDRNLEGQTVLEVGSGAGRFTAPALSTGATLISLDYSNAVEANYAVNGTHDNLLLVQADVYAIPVRRDFVDKAFCFGVLQHTPDPHASFQRIVTHLKPGGRIASDIYRKTWTNWLHVKPYLRALVRTRSTQSLYRFTVAYVDAFWPLTRMLRSSNAGRRIIGRFIAERSDQLPGASDALLREWSYLDTFDWFSPAYDQPQTLEVFKEWHQEAGLAEIDVRRGYNGVEGRAMKPL
jgi:SAM-dependent methyltransferase